MKEKRIPFLSIVLLIAGVTLIGLFIADKADIIIGICGMILCTLAAGIRLRTMPKNRPS